MEIKTETLAEQFQTALKYQKEQLPLEFDNAVARGDIKTVIHLLLTYPTFYFTLRDASTVIKSVQDEREAIEFLELLFVHPHFNKSDFLHNLKCLIDAAVMSRQVHFVIYLLKKNSEFSSRFRPHTPEPTLTGSVCTIVDFEKLSTKHQQMVGKDPSLLNTTSSLWPHLRKIANPEYHDFFDTLVLLLLKEEGKLWEEFKMELVSHYMDRRENSRSDILFSILKMFYFSENNSQGLSVVNKVLPWASQNGHANIVSLFVYDETIPKHFLNSALDTAFNSGKTSIFVPFALEKYWPTIRLILLTETDESCELFSLLIKDCLYNISEQYILAQAHAHTRTCHLYFFSLKNTIESSPKSAIEGICRFLLQEKNRLVDAYWLTNGVNQFLHVVKTRMPSGGSYGYRETDYPKPARLGRIKIFLCEHIDRFGSDDIPTIIALIYSVCSTKNHMLSADPTSLTNFVKFCEKNNFAYPDVAVLGEERLSELFQGDLNISDILDEVRRESALELK